MSNTPNAVSSVSVLSVVPSSDSSPAGDEPVWTLELIIKEMIDSTPDADGLTVEDVLHDKDFKDIKILAEKIKEDRQSAQRVAAQAKEAARQQELKRIKKGKAASLRTTVLQAAGFNPLSEADLAKVDQLLVEPNQTKGQSNKGSQSGSNESGIPEEVLRVLGSIQLPHSLFDKGWKAQSMRCHLVRSARWIQDQRNQLIPANDQELIKLYNERNQELSALIRKCERVIGAWGLKWDKDHRNEWATTEQNKEMWEVLEQEFPKLFELLSVLPKLESPEEKKVRETAEAVRLAKVENISKLYSKLMDRLVKANPNGLPNGFADRCASKRSKVEKYLGIEITEELITSIFAETAINRLKVAEEAKTDAEKEQGRNTAMLYANAAGMDEEALKKGLADMCKQREADAVAASAKVVEKRGAKFGEAPPVVKSNKDKGEGKPRKGKKGVKPDGDNKPVKPARGKRQ